MLDTVKLRLLDYEVDKNSNITVYPGTVKLSGELIRSFKLFSLEDGSEIGGMKAHLNTDKFQLDFNSKGTFVKFSAPNVYYDGNNYQPVNQQQTKEVFKRIESDLRDNGIKTNIFESDLSRIDMFKQITPDEQFYNYAPIFRAIKGIPKKFVDYGTTGYLWGNSKTEQTAVYDKLAEMVHKEKDISGLPDTIRFENRLLNKHKIDTVLEFTKGKELVNYYGELEEAYNKNLKKCLFILDDKEFNEVIQNQIEASFEFYYQYGGRLWIDKFIFGLGLDTVETYGLENILSLARRKWNKNEKQRAYNLKRRLQKRMIESKMARQGTPSKTLLTLYNELKHKLVA